MTKPWLRLIGPPGLFRSDGTEIPFPTRKQLALLVFLTLDAARRGVHRDRIIDLLWSGVSPERGRHSLSQGLSEIRHRLGNESVNRGGDYVTLHHQLPTDVSSLQLIRSRVSCRPLILEGFEHVAGSEFAHWVDAARTRLLRQLTVSLNREIDVQRTTGNLALVRERAQQLYEVSPESVRAVSILAEQAAAEGKLTDALYLIDTLIADRELKEGHRDFETLQKLRTKVERTRRGRTPAENSGSDWQLVGRTEILTHLYCVLTNSQAPGTRTVLVTGTPGIGKTALVRQFGATARADGHVCFEMTCSKDQADFSIIASCARQMMPYSELGATDPAWLAELAMFAPFLRARYPGIPKGSTRGPMALSPTSGAVALNHAFEAINSGGTILMVLDEVDCLDNASRQVLRCLAEIVDGVDLLLLGTRADAWASQQGDTEPEPVDWHQIIPLGPLRPEQTQALIADGVNQEEHRLDRQAIQRLVAWSNGVPLLAQALIRDTAHQRVFGSSQPDTVTTVEDGWHLSPETKAALDRYFHSFWTRATAPLQFLCLGAQPFGAELLAKLCHRSASELDELLRLGLDLGILDVVGERFTFSSPIFRAFVRSSTTEARRRYCSAAIAGRLQGRDPDQANRGCTASPAAQRHHRPDRQERQRGTADDNALLLAGELAARSRNWDRFNTIARNANQMPPSRNSFRDLSIAFFSMTGGDYHRAIRRFQRGITSLTNMRDSKNLARAYNGLGTSALALGRFLPAVKAFAKAFDIARGTNNRAYAGAMASNIGVACADFDFQKKARHWFDLSVKSLGDAPVLPYRATILANYIDHKLLLDDIPAAAEVWESAEAVMDKCDAASRGYLLCARADLLLAQGELDQACETITMAEQAFLEGSNIEDHRFVMGFDSPHLARLSYFKASLKKSNETQQVMEKAWPTTAMPVTQQVELLAVFVWRKELTTAGLNCSDPVTTSGRVVRMIQETGAAGVVRRLRAVGMLGKSLNAAVC